MKFISLILIIDNILNCMEADFNFFLFKEADLSGIISISILKAVKKSFGFQFSHRNDTQEQGMILMSLLETTPITIGHIFSKLSSYKSIIILHLQHLGLNDTCIKIIKKAKLTKIMQAYLSGNAITHVGVTHLIEGNWDNLQILCLSENPIKNKGLQQLAKSKWPNLISISLNCTSITDDGIKCLAKAQWPQLKTIALHDNHLSNASFKQIIKSSFLKLKGIIFQLEQTNKAQDQPAQPMNTFFNHNLAAKFHPNWKQTYFMAHFENASKKFKEMIKYKNDKLFDQDQQQPLDEDEP